MRFFVLIQKIKIVSLNWNLEHQFVYAEFSGDIHFTIFSTRNTLFRPGYENCQIKLKSGTNTNLNMQNSVVVFSFSIFDRKYPFWSNLVQKVLVGFLGVRFEVESGGMGGGGAKITSSVLNLLELREKLEIWHVSTHVYKKFQKIYLVLKPRLS